MSALTTRILVLGVVSIFGPANGYQLRRELLSWEVERWAHLNPGSIYSMLSTLEKQGAIERHDIALEDGGRPVAVYTIDGCRRGRVHRAGRSRRSATVPDSGDALPLRVALNFGPAMTRSRVPAASSAAIDVLVMGCEIIGQKITRLRAGYTVPPHVVSDSGSRLRSSDAQLEWLRGLETDVTAGPGFVGDPSHGTAGRRPPTIRAGRWRRSAIGTSRASPSSGAPESSST